MRYRTDHPRSERHALRNIAISRSCKIYPARPSLADPTRIPDPNGETMRLFLGCEPSWVDLRPEHPSPRNTSASCSTVPFPTGKIYRRRARFLASVEANPRMRVQRRSNVNLRCVFNAERCFFVDVRITKSELAVLDYSHISGVRRDAAVRARAVALTLGGSLHDARPAGA